jgi:phytoene dehydrogenase-like protein
VPDAVVIGAGHNGLVAANVLADAGWSVVVLEAQAEPGGAVRTEELTSPGFRHDVFSAFYPLAVASPVLRSMNLDHHGLRWCRTPIALAHPTPDGRCAYVADDVDETAASLDSYQPGDGDGWRRLYGQWEVVHEPLLGALLSTFPPVRHSLRLATTLGAAGLLRFTRFATLPVRRLAEEEFTGAGGGLLLAGNALHADFSPESTLGGFFGWLLACLAQQVGFPVPEGGAAQLARSLVRRLDSRGGSVECDTRVSGIIVRDGRARGVTLADGGDVLATRAVLADVDAPTLYLDLLEPEHLPSRVLADITRFQWDPSTIKVDWALDGPVPWEAEPARRAGTVHVAESMDQLTQWSADLAKGLVPAEPFLLFGQQSLADPTRCPPGTATAWAYTRVPRRIRGDAASSFRNGDLTGAWTPAELDRFADRMEARVEALAPGFRSLVRGRHVAGPARIEAADTSLRGGAINGGTAQLHQQLVFRPTPGMARPETPVSGLFLASSSAHPGGGVHGAPGANAARAALAAAGWAELPARAMRTARAARHWVDQRGAG